MSGEEIELQGTLEGHGGWVTCIATSFDDPDTIVTGSRDKSVIVWRLRRVMAEDDDRQARMQITGDMQRRLLGHNHFIEDIDLSYDRQYCISASWDGTLRLWNLATGDTQTRFVGHQRDVLSVAFSKDNRRIVSGSRDRSVKIWNAIGVCKRTMLEDGGHTDWVTCVRFSPNAEDEHLIVSCGRDHVVKVWNVQNGTLKHNLEGHRGYVNSVTVSPDGSLCASGGKQGVAILWDLKEGKELSSLDAGDEIYALCFSPNRYWLCGAVGSVIHIWDLETKQRIAKLELPTDDDDAAEEVPAPQYEKRKRKRYTVPILCISLAWSHDGKTLFAGYTDNLVRIWCLVGA